MQLSTSDQIAAGADRVQKRLAELGQIGQLGEGLLPPELVGRCRDVAARAGARLGHGTANTVVALAGATGSGKSAVFNAVARAEISRSGVRRPTTSATEALTFGDPADGLLDWLEVKSRHVQADPELSGLVLLDLPDHDSIAASHRREVDRLVEVVDVFCWVVDPQKYADAALHDGYLKRFGGHGAVTIVLLNQIDRLDQAQRDACVTHLQKLLADDGLGDARVLPCSALTGEGIDALRTELSARVAERKATVKRLDADLDWLGTGLVAACGPHDPRPVTDAQKDAVAAAFADVVGARAVADAAASAVRYRTSLATGWPPSRWIGRLRPDPLRRLGLSKRDVVSDTAVVARTSIPAGSAVARAGVTTAITDLVSGAAEGLPPEWKERLRTAATPDGDDLVDALDHAVGGADVAPDPPGWWRPIGGLQWLLATIAAVGLIWLIVLGVLAWLKVPEPPTPDWQGWPLPTLFLLGGVVAGLIVAAVSRRMGSAAAALHRRKVLNALRDRTEVVAKERVVAPIDAEIARIRHVRALVASFARK